MGSAVKCDSRGLWGGVRPEARGSHILKLFSPEKLQNMTPARFGVRSGQKKGGDISPEGSNM